MEKRQYEEDNMTRLSMTREERGRLKKPHFVDELKVNPFNFFFLIDLSGT